MSRSLSTDDYDSEDKPHRLDVEINRSSASLFPANTGHCPCVGSMLGQRRRRWASIEPPHGQCPVFTGLSVSPPAGDAKHLILDTRC